MEAEWADDEDVWLNQSLIVSCIDSELIPYDFHNIPQPIEFYIGIDFGKERDYSIVVVAEKAGQVLRGFMSTVSHYIQSTQVSLGTSRVCKIAGKGLTLSMQT